MVTADKQIGLVLRIDAKVCHVEVDGRRLQLPLRGRLFEAGGARRPLAVGDRVEVALAADGGAIESVLPRTSQLTRAAAGGRGEQVLAANITLVLATASLADPPFDSCLVDRILAGAERQQIPAALVLTKTDLVGDAAAAGVAARYRRLSYPVFPTSVTAGEPAALESLRTLLHRNRTVLCGASGAGKSSLVNSLVPELGRKVGHLGRLRQGKHTTTHTELVPLPDGGHLLDTPGIRSFGLYGATADEIPFLFRELRERLGRCTFRDCRHRTEPGCAIRAAVEAGEIEPSRIASFEALIAETGA